MAKKKTTEETKFKATLVEGDVYIAGDKYFHTAAPTQVISEKLKKYLEGSAVIKQVTRTGGKKTIKSICRFEFEEIGAEGLVGAGSASGDGEDEYAGEHEPTT